LKPDRAGREGQSFGSYLVFRKLEQDVEGFHSAIDQLAKQLNISRDFALAQTIGRFKDGTPLVLAGNPLPHILQPPNNFNYANDFHGLKCPLHAHIRKANPRGSVSLRLPSSFHLCF
jgi:deferrochelatase/peroxidase EfeB